MVTLIKNEFIKIFKRKNIYILLFLSMLVLLVYNLYLKTINPKEDIGKLYESAYDSDMLYLEYYENFSEKEDYSTIVERINLEKYAIENKINYNILLNSENNNSNIPEDARILLMRFFSNFEIIIVFIIIYIASSIFLEEFQNGTIKNALVKPHKRVTIILSKLIASIIISLILAIIIVLLQYLLGDIIYGFDSYSLEAIRYNFATENIVTMNLFTYILIIFCSKIPMFIIFSLIIILLGVLTNNIPITILFSLSLYAISKLEIFINSVKNIYYWDLSKYLFGEITGNLAMAIFISIIIIAVLTSAITIIFKRKDIVNE